MTNEQIDKLREMASLWRGTPWVPNSEAIGKGVSCHNLPRALYIACGALTDDFPKIIGDPTQSRHTTVSHMESVLDGRPEFERVPLSPILPGDLLGIRIYRCVDHLGIALGAGLFVHVLMHKHVDTDMTGVAPWSERIQAVWRPRC
jgi:hypothetical protein